MFIRLLLLTVAVATAADPVSFNKDVRSILSDRCFKCHGPDAENQKSEFRLDTAEHAYADLGDYAGIVPGDVQASELHHRIRSTDDDDIMPPPGSNLSLTEAEKDILDAWISQGAPFEKHWSLHTLPDKIAVPQADHTWAKNPIDHFISAKLQEQEFTPAPAPASPKEKWLRRVTFDLTGLPPTLSEIDSFLEDDSEGAHETVVERLLHTDAYAERMTSEWLDVARYSDSYGYQRDHERFVWPWRDWVIQAFQKNMPYDEFVTLQLAGDLLPDATQDQILPTAFNRLHAHKMEVGIVLEEYRVEYVADRTQTFSSAFLGLTMECSRCHDHKYDPLPTKDYYELSAFLANIDEAGLISYFTEETPTPAMPVATAEQRDALDKAQLKIDDAEAALERIRSETASASQIELPGPVAHVSFDGELPDLEDNTQVAGHVGKAVHLTGDDPFTVPEVGRFPREQPFSASLWIKASEITERANLMSRSGGGDDAAHLGYELLLLDGKPTASLIHFWPGNAIRIQAKEPIPVNTWQHLVMTYDGSSRASGLSIYLNGRPLDTEIIRDHLTRQITTWTGGRDDIVLGQRYRDRGFVNGEIDEFILYDRELDPKAVASLAKNQLHTDFMPSNEQEALTALQATRQAWNQLMDSIPDISIMRELPKPRPTYLLVRGGYDNHGERVMADTPSALPPFPEDLPRNRLGLAKWLTDPNHPLASRVVVNRYWQMLFGEGIVHTPEDFGSQGAAPTHPELLDWLSRDFINHDWDIHHLLKQIVLSATYRQSTLADPEKRERDPENQLLARGHGYRLAAEMIRDNALAASNLLVSKVGGAPVKPYEVAASFLPEEPGEGNELYRRSLYTWWKRNAPAPVMVTFDAAKRDVCSVRREPTSSPLQSLVLLNGPQFTEASRVLAANLLKKHGNDVSSLVEEAHRLLTSRRPDSSEAAILKSLYQEQKALFANEPKAAEKLLNVGNAPSETTSQKPALAAATVLVNSLMNLDEALHQR